MAGAKKSVPVAPSDADLRAQLGKSFGALETLLERNADLRPEWKYYGAKLGWNLKLFDKTRNLCFIAPHQDHLVIGFALGAKLVDEALRSDLPAAVKRDIKEGRTYVEGRAVRVVVRRPQDLRPVQILLDLKRGR